MNKVKKGVNYKMDQLVRDMKEYQRNDLIAIKTEKKQIKEKFKG